MYEISKNFQAVLDQILRQTQEELGGVRASRPSAGMLENVMVECYGQTLPLKHVATISVNPPRELIVEPWDKEILTIILKAIEGVGAGLSARMESTGIRAFLPELSGERREELSKLVKKMSEEGRIKIRHARDDANKRAEIAQKEKEITEDQRFSLRAEIQKITDNANEKIESLVSSKIKEIQE
jgi:ribosome recycling factor